MSARRRNNRLGAGLQQLEVIVTPVTDLNDSSGRRHDLWHACRQFEASFSQLENESYDRCHVAALLMRPRDVAIIKKAHIDFLRSTDLH